jgi:iron complex outermembrane receptor protein
MKKFSGFAALLMSASVVAVSAQAQTAPSGASTPTAAPSNQIEDVVVTAERRSESLQQVPIAVSVISGEELSDRNLHGLTDLQFMAPSVQYNAFTGGGFQIRGVGTQTVNLTSEQDVGIVIDDVVQGIEETDFAAPSYQALTDIDHIEVLKGPQGTLFGKNSSVGVLQIITKKPILNTLEGDGSVSYGSGNEVWAQANINIPVSKDAALRISGWDERRDGYIDNVYTGQKLSGYDQYGIRGKFLWQPRDDLSVYLIAEDSHTIDSGNGTLTLRSCGSGFAGFSPCATDAAYGVVASPTNTKVALDGPTGSETSTVSSSLHVDYDVGGGNTLTSVTAYIHKTQTEGVDPDASPLRVLSIDITQAHSEEYTQELRLSSPSDQFLEYTVGAFFYRVNSTEANVLAGTFNFLPNNSPILLSNGFADPSATGGQTLIATHTTSYAGYGQATAHITDKFSLTGGLRLTHDDLWAGTHVGPYPNICEFNYAFGAPCHTITLPSPVLAATASHTNISGRAIAKYDFTDTVNAYASFATGYKGPAISYSSSLPPFAVHPETSKDYELGVKSQFFDKRLTINADVFYEKYSQFQADSYVYDAANPGASNFVLGNAGGLQSKGVEADTTWVATDNLTLTGNMAYTPTKFTQFAIQCQDAYTNPATPPGQCNYIPPGSAPGTPAQFNAAGYPLPQAPKFSYTLSADYMQPVFSGYMLEGYVDWAWHSSAYTVVANPNSIQTGYGLLGMNIGFGPEDGNWKLSVFARNLLDQKFASAIFPTYLDNGAATGIPLPTQGYANVPNIESQRTVGVKLQVKLGG